MNALSSAGLSDQVLFATLNVFGRTIGPGNTDGRQHNENHQVSITIGKSIRAGVVGGIAPVDKDYGATNVDSKSGQSSAQGDIAAIDTLAAYGQTLLAAVGVDPSVISSQITAGSVVLLHRVRALDRAGDHAAVIASVRIRQREYWDVLVEVARNSERARVAVLVELEEAQPIQRAV
jgi:hypothetical protein